MTRHNISVHGKCSITTTSSVARYKLLFQAKHTKLPKFLGGKQNNLAKFPQPDNSNRRSFVCCFHHRPKWLVTLQCYHPTLISAFEGLAGVNLKPWLQSPNNQNWPVQPPQKTYYNFLYISKDICSIN